MMPGDHVSEECDVYDFWKVLDVWYDRDNYSVHGGSLNAYDFCNVLDIRDIRNNCSYHGLLNVL
jgi:hypothetical protein